MEQYLPYLKRLNILFIEDNPVMLEKTASTLKIFFDKVLCAQSVLEAFSLYHENRVDFILSDIQLHDETIFEFLEEVRLSNYSLPIVLLSSYYENSYLLKASNISVDGYVIKPIELNQLLQTLTKAIKRNLPSKMILHLSNGIAYNLFSKELLHNNQLIILGKKEQELFELLVYNKDRYISREEIMESLWPAEEITDSAVRNLINRIRAKLTQDIIVTAKGLGWKLGR